MVPSRPRTAPAHGQRARAGESERGAQRLRAHAGVAGRNRLHQCAEYPAFIRKCASSIWALLAAHPDQDRIYVVCDNARYYKNRALQEWPLVQVFLPPYSPNLNLIERFWKFLRQKIINPNFFRTKGEFRRAVLGFFDRLAEFEQELASLLTRKFHILDAQTTS
ncbi:MAG: transposase [Janthinobacterium lividum]